MKAFEQMEKSVAKKQETQKHRRDSVPENEVTGRKGMCRKNNKFKKSTDETKDRDEKISKDTLGKGSSNEANENEENKDSVSDGMTSVPSGTVLNNGAVSTGCTSKSANNNNNNNNNFNYNYNKKKRSTSKNDDDDDDDDDKEEEDDESDAAVTVKLEAENDSPVSRKKVAYTRTKIKDEARDEDDDDSVSGKHENGHEETSSKKDDDFVDDSRCHSAAEGDDELTSMTEEKPERESSVPLIKGKRKINDTQGPRKGRYRVQTARTSRMKKIGPKGRAAAKPKTTRAKK